MTPAEYIQLKAFARYDGALLALLWTAAFAAYVAGMASPACSLLAMALMLATPFYVCRRLANYRDAALGGVISLRRAWAYAATVTFYAAILLALAQYVYFAYIDRGYLLQTFAAALADPEVNGMLQQAGLKHAVDDTMAQMTTMRPIDFALNMLSVNIACGIVMGLPIGALMQRNNGKKTT